jgi:hypothetical protein
VRRNHLFDDGAKLLQPADVPSEHETNKRVPFLLLSKTALLLTVLLGRAADSILHEWFELQC